MPEDMGRHLMQLDIMSVHFIKNVRAIISRFSIFIPSCCKSDFLLAINIFQLAIKNQKPAKCAKCSQGKINVNPNE